MDEAKVIALFAFMRCDAVLCSATPNVGKRGPGEFVWGNLAFVRAVGRGGQFDGHPVFTCKTERETVARKEKVA